MFDLNRAERKALATALVLMGVSVLVRTALAPDPGQLDGVEALALEGDVGGLEGEVLAALRREQRAQTPLAQGERIEVNRAPADELRRLPGVGPSLAAAIMQERELAPFLDANDLKRVRGVGEVTAARLAPHLDFGGALDRRRLASADGGDALGSSAAARRSSGPALSAAGSVGSTGCTAGKVDVNRATRAELETLTGVGPVIAERIVADRSANGRFDRAEALQRVRGIGPRTVARLADRVCTGAP